MAKVLYKEVQWFRQNVVWAILLLIPVVVFGSILVYQLATGTGVGDRPMSNRALALLGTAVFIPSVLAFFRVKLTTIIDEEKIQYGWNMPTPEPNIIMLKDIKEWAVIKYDFVGYGYRISKRYGTVHNLIGNRGLFIETFNGERVLIGTQNLRELKTLVESMPVGQQPA